MQDIDKYLSFLQVNMQKKWVRNILKFQLSQEKVNFLIEVFYLVRYKSLFINYLIYNLSVINILEF